MASTTIVRGRAHRTALHALMSISLLLLITVALQPLHAAASTPDTNSCSVILYGRHTCPHCMATYEALKKLGLNITFLDVEVDKEAAKAYAEMFKKYMLKLTTMAGVPLTYVRCGNYTMLILGEVIAPGYTTADEYKLWAKLLEALMNGTGVAAAGNKITFKSVTCLSLPTCGDVLPRINQSLFEKGAGDMARRVFCLGGLALCLASNETITPILPGQNVSSETSSPAQAQNELLPLIPALVGLALLDAINPCFLALYTITVAAVASIRGYRAALATGLGVALGVFTGYYLLGLGLLAALASLPWLRVVLAAAVIALGVFTTLRDRGIIRFGGEECLVCKLAVKLKVGSAEMTPILGYLFGFISSLTLLPCSAGPYAIAAIYLDGLPLVDKLVGLAIYNIVFIAPILAMAMAASVVAAYTRLQEKIRPLIGPLLIALGIYVLLEPQLGLMLRLG